MGAMDAMEILINDRDEWKKRALAAEEKLRQLLTSSPTNGDTYRLSDHWGAMAKRDV